MVISMNGNATLRNSFKNAIALLEMILEALNSICVEQHSSFIHSSSEERLLALMKSDPRMTIPSMAQQLGLGERQVRRLIASLKEKRKIRREGSNKSGCWIVTSLSR